MSLLWKTLSQYDSDSLDDLLPLLGKKKLEGSKEDKYKYIVDKLFSLTKVDPFLGELSLMKMCLKLTAEKFDVYDDDFVNQSEEDQINKIDESYRESLEIKLKQLQKYKILRKKKIKKIAEDFQEELSSQGKTIIGSGTVLLDALKAGKSAGLPLIAGTTVGLSTLGLMFGATSSIGAISGVAATSSLFLGPIGWAATIPILSLGGWKYLKDYKSNQLFAFTLTLITDIQNQKNEILLKKYENYYKKVETNSLEMVQLTKDIATFFKNIDKPIIEVANLSWYKNIIKYLPDVET